VNREEEVEIAMTTEMGIPEQAEIDAELTSGPGGGSWNRMPPVATYGPWLALIAMIVIFPMFNGRFLSTTNGLNILRQSSVLLVLALSATFVVLMGSIDLSVGSVVSLCGMGGAILLADYGEPAVFLVLLIGLAAGSLNGLLFSYGKLPSFLVTLGTLFALQGVTLYWSDGIASVVDPKLTVSTYFSGDLWQIPVITLWAIGVLLATMFVASKTRFGRYMYAIGGGENASLLSGVPVRRYKFYAFAIGGLLAGFGGMLLMFRINGGDPTMGEPFLLPAIAAVVMGGTPLTGGVGGPHRTLLGVLIITILSNGMNLARVDAFLQDVVLGSVVVVATALTMDRSRVTLVK
jgi:ribose/xylose/arabinose/galactoside ABC-type transport system permease subunit